MKNLQQTVTTAKESEDEKKKRSRFGLFPTGFRWLKVAVKPQAFKRCVANQVSNACRFADNVTIKASRRNHHLIVAVEDDGPGIAADDREEVFRPFYRLDHARNQDTGGTGLGLAIALDIAHSHGGDIKLSTSQAGGLKAELSIPV